MKWHTLVISLLLASFVIISAMPEDPAALGARDVQSLKSVQIAGMQPLSGASQQGSVDKADKSTGDEVLVGKKSKKKKLKLAKAKKKKKKQKMKDKAKKSKATPAKTKKQKKK